MTSLIPLQLISIPYAIVAIRARIQPLSSEKVESCYHSNSWTVNYDSVASFPLFFKFVRGLKVGRETLPITCTAYAMFSRFGFEQNTTALSISNV